MTRRSLHENRLQTGFRFAAISAGVAMCMAVLFAICPRLHAQSAAPDREATPGEKLSFDSSSVVENTSGKLDIDSSISLTSLDAYADPGNHFFGKNWSVGTYILFAFKLTNYQNAALGVALPKSVRAKHYDIDGITTGHPSEEQLRLMLRSLLEDRFKLKAHWEPKPASVNALVVAKPGKLGQWLQEHTLSSPQCSSENYRDVRDPAPTVKGGFPAICGHLMGVRTGSDSTYRTGARNLTMPEIADMLQGIAEFQRVRVSRPLIDDTSLTGKYDFVIAWPDWGMSEHDFYEQINHDLGLEVKTATHTLEYLVIDHIEEPSKN